jgi:hypothetical protein
VCSNVPKATPVVSVAENRPMTHLPHLPNQARPNLPHLATRRNATREPCGGHVEPSGMDPSAGRKSQT